MQIFRDEAEIIGTDGKPLAGYEATIPADYRGLERFVARKKIVADFEALGLLDENQTTRFESPLW